MINHNNEFPDIESLLHLRINLTGLWVSSSFSVLCHEVTSKFFFFLKHGRVSRSIYFRLCSKQKNKAQFHCTLFFMVEFSAFPEVTGTAYVTLIQGPGEGEGQSYCYIFVRLNLITLLLLTTLLWLTTLTELGCLACHMRLSKSGLLLLIPSQLHLPLLPGFLLVLQEYMPSNRNLFFLGSFFLSLGLLRWLNGK